MLKPDLVHENTFDGVQMKFELFLTDDFSDLENVSQAYTLIANESDELLLVAGKKKLWVLPGGGIEKGESAADAAIREAYEEGAVVLTENALKPFFYQKVYMWKDEGYQFDCTQVRYAARPDRVEEFVSDPDNGDIVHHMWCPIDDLHNHLMWSDTTKLIQEHIHKYL